MTNISTISLEFSRIDSPSKLFVEYSTELQLSRLELHIELLSRCLFLEHVFQVAQFLCLCRDQYLIIRELAIEVLGDLHYLKGHMGFNHEAFARLHDLQVLLLQVNQELKILIIHDVKRLQESVFLARHHHLGALVALYALWWHEFSKPASLKVGLVVGIVVISFAKFDSCFREQDLKVVLTMGDDLDTFA